MSEPTKADEDAARVIAAVDEASELAGEQEFAEHPPFSERPEGMEELGARVRRLSLTAIKPLLDQIRAEARRDGDVLRERRAGEARLAKACERVKGEEREACERIVVRVLYRHPIYRQRILRRLRERAK